MFCNTITHATHSTFLPPSLALGLFVRIISWAGVKPQLVQVSQNDRGDGTWGRLIVLPWSLSLVKTQHTKKSKCVLFSSFIVSHIMFLKCLYISTNEFYKRKTWLQKWSVSQYPEVTFELLTQAKIAGSPLTDLCPLIGHSLTILTCDWLRVITGSSSSRVWPQSPASHSITRELLTLLQFKSDIRQKYV